MPCASCRGRACVLSCRRREEIDRQRPRNRLDRQCFLVALCRQRHLDHGRRVQPTGPVPLRGRERRRRRAPLQQSASPAPGSAGLRQASTPRQSRRLGYAAAPRRPSPAQSPSVARQSSAARSTFGGAVIFRRRRHLRWRRLSGDSTRRSRSLRTNPPRQIQNPRRRSAAQRLLGQLHFMDAHLSRQLALLQLTRVARFLILREPLVVHFVHGLAARRPAALQSGSQRRHSAGGAVRRGSIRP